MKEFWEFFEIYDNSPILHQLQPRILGEILRSQGERNLIAFGKFSVSPRILLLCEKISSGLWVLLMGFNGIWCGEFCVKWVGSKGLGSKNFRNDGFGCGNLRVLIKIKRICFFFSSSFPLFWIELLLLFQVYIVSKVYTWESFDLWRLRSVIQSFRSWNIFPNCTVFFEMVFRSWALPIFLKICDDFVFMLEQ